VLRYQHATTNRVAKELKDKDMYRTPAFIVAWSGPLREGLRAVLTAMPQVSVVGEADSVSSILGIALKEDPALVLLSADGPIYDARDSCRQVKLLWPEAGCIFLADTVHQRRIATAAGADTVLLKGFQAEKLFSAIESLLARIGKTEEETH
jgi:NarL family two-component system response regulator LiaR